MVPNRGSQLGSECEEKNDSWVVLRREVSQSEPPGGHLRWQWRTCQHKQNTCFFSCYMKLHLGVIVCFV